MQITTFRMIFLTLLNEYDPWPGATTFRTFQLPGLIADTLTAGHGGAEGIAVELKSSWRHCLSIICTSRITTQLAGQNSFRKKDADSNWQNKINWFSFMLGFCEQRGGRQGMGDSLGFCDTGC